MTRVKQILIQIMVLGSLVFVPSVSALVAQQPAEVGLQFVFRDRATNEGDGHVVDSAHTPIAASMEVFADDDLVGTEVIGIQTVFTVTNIMSETFSFEPQEYPGATTTVYELESTDTTKKLAVIYLPQEGTSFPLVKEKVSIGQLYMDVVEVSPVRAIFDQEYTKVLQADTLKNLARAYGIANYHFFEEPNTPTSTKTPTPSPSSQSTIDWRTNFAYLTADSMIISVNGNYFYGLQTPTRLHSDPGTSSYSTLELEWAENDVDMRLYFYFHANPSTNTWYIDSVRTYDGSTNHNQLYYYSLRQASQKLYGEPFTADKIVLTSQDGSGTITFKNLAIQGFLQETPRPITTMTPTPSTPAPTPGTPAPGTPAPSTPTPAPPVVEPDKPRITTGLKVSYYEGQNFDKFIYASTDPEINFNWKRGKALETLSADNFSIRWAGSIKIEETGVYYFALKADDGVKLSINGAKLIDDWKTSNKKTRYGTIELKADYYYPIIVDYFEAKKNASVQLLWKKPGDKKYTVVPTENFTPQSRSIEYREKQTVYGIGDNAFVDEIEYIQYVPQEDPTTIRQVDFYLDNKRVTRDKSYPYFLGGDNSGQAKGYKTRKIKPGTHTLKIKVTKKDRTTYEETIQIRKS